MASSLVPDYKVKVLLKPSDVLGSNNELKDEVLSVFSISSSTKKINIQFVDTKKQDFYKNDWNLRVRKIEGDDKFELTYKKRYPIGNRYLTVKDNFDMALKMAEREISDLTTTYEAQIEVGYQKQTLSISHDERVPDTGFQGIDLPSTEDSRKFLANKAPIKFKNWSASNWGTDYLAESIVYGPVLAKRTKGTWDGDELFIEVWPIWKSKTDASLEPFVEASFNTLDLEKALEGRAKLVIFLQNRGWFLAEDSLKTKLIMERYGEKTTADIVMTTNSKAMDEQLRPPRILSLESGGLAFLSSLFILQEMMMWIMHEQNLSGPAHPWEVFDLIGGAGLGGLAAIMLGRLRMSVQECIDECLELSRLIFPSKNHPLDRFFERTGQDETKDFEQALKSLLTKRGLRVSEIFEQTDVACKVCVLATRRETASTDLLRSYASPPSNVSSKDFKIWQVARATVAAPAFFDPISMDSSSVTYFDGDIGHGNPVTSIFEEAKTIWPNSANDAVLVSIGTGTAPPPSLSGVGKKYTKMLQSIAIASEIEAERFLRHHVSMVSSGQYFRFNVEDRSLESQKDIRPSRLRAATLYYLKQDDVVVSLRRCVNALIQPVSTGRLQADQTRVSMGGFNQEVKRVLSLLKLDQPYGSVPALASPLNSHLSDAVHHHPSYLSWINSKSSILWLHGPAGIGKTQLCLSLSKHLDAFEVSSRRPSLVISFFCSKKRFTRSYGAVFDGLVYQIIEKCPEIVAKSDLQRGPDPPARETPPLSFDRVLETVWKDNLLGGLTCIVDGLDECDSATIHVILETIQRLVNMFSDDESDSPFIRFVIASRRVPQIQNWVLGGRYAQIQLSELVESEVAQNQIAGYIDAEFEQEKYSLLQSVQNDVKNSIVQASNGNFLWTGLMLQQLEYKSADEATAIVRDIPRVMFDVYNEILDRVPRPHRIRVLTLLNWIAVARRPLTLRELNPALEPYQDQPHEDGEQTVREELQYCVPLCIISDKTVLLSHTTVREYLLSNARNTSEEVIEARIADKCFECLSQQAWVTGSGITADGLDLEAFPLLNYALYHWPEHARSVGDQICQFLNPMASFYDDTSPQRAAWYGLYERHRQAQGNGDPFFPSATLNSFTSMHLAAFLGLEKLAERLIARGADVYAKDNLGRSPLAYASYFGYATIIRTLCQAFEVNLSLLDHQGASLLHYASAGGNTEVVQTLLDHGVSAGVRDKLGNTPLHVATISGHFAAMQILIDCGYENILLKNALDRTPLHLACQAGQFAAASRLLIYNADPNSKDYRGQTPLHDAARNGNERTVQVLLEHNANPSIKSNEGQTALAIAQENGHSGVVRMILRSPSQEVVELESSQTRDLPQLTADPCGYIASMLQDLPNSKDGDVTLDVEIRWEVLKFIDKELSGNEGTIPNMLTLSGESSRAVAKQCKEYMAMTWPNTGLVTLQLLASLFELSRMNPEQTLRLAWAGVFNFDVTVYPEDPGIAQAEKALLTVSGTREQVVEVIQQIAWFACVFRLPIADNLGYSKLERVQKIVLSEDILLLIELSTVTAENPRGPKDRFGSCWQPLFRNTVIAYGFPVPERGGEPGLEVPFDIMTSLAGIENMVAVAPSTFLIGPTALIHPVASGSESVQWHLVIRKEDEDYSNLDMATLPKQFRLMRTFLGFCRRAEVVVGTASFNDTDATTSKAEKEEDFMVLKDNAFTASATVSAGLGAAISPVPVNVSGTLGAAFQRSRGLQANKDENFGGVDSRVIVARDRSVIVYDVDRKIGWLVPEASVALWLAHAFIRWHLSALQDDEAARIRALIASPALHAREQGDGATAAFSVIRDNKKVPLWLQDDDKQATFIDVIKYVLGCFDRRRDCFIVSTKQVKVKEKNNLYGWEASDIVDETGTVEGSYRKEVSTSYFKTSPTWWQLSKDPKLLVLFSANLPDLIRPAENSQVCLLWQRIPFRYNCLCASIPCIFKMAKNLGCTNGGIFKLTQDIGWNQPQIPFYSCFGKGCNPVQSVATLSKLKRSYSSESIQTAAGSGAVIFGNPSNFTKGKDALLAPAATINLPPSEETHPAHDSAPGPALGPALGPAPTQNQTTQAPATMHTSGLATIPNPRTSTSPVTNTAPVTSIPVAESASPTDPIPTAGFNHIASARASV